MSQDWSMIPLHIRCSERYKIDPTYPEDGCRWWKLTENTTNRMGDERTGAPYKGVPKMVLEYAAELEGNPLAIQNLAGTCGVEVEVISSGIRAVKSGQKIGAKYLAHKYEEMSPQEERFDKWLQNN